MSYTILIILGGITSFFLSFLAGKFIIPMLKKLKVRQTILEIGPSWHKTKEGTPTMGGIIFIVPIIISCFVFIMAYYKFLIKDIFFSGWSFDRNYFNFSFFSIISGLLMAVSYGLIGFFDDYIKITKKQNLGLTPKQKLALQFFVAFFYLFLKSFIQIISGFHKITVIKVPFFNEIDLGIFYWIVSAIFIVGTVNAVNLTDGVDGLDISVTFFVSCFLLAIALIFNYQILGILISAALGAYFGFFIYNAYPAKIFMGDTGSLFLGGLLCSIAFTMNVPFFLIIIGAIYYIEMFSVILQVAYFKITKGKRLFKMTPIHHHFELLKFSEKKICVTFSAFTILCGAVAILLLFYT